MGSADTLTIGTAGAYAPYSSYGDSGELEGFDIDVAKALAQELGNTLEIKDLGSLPALSLALAQQQVDALIWAISITPSRKNTMTMIHYQGAVEATCPLLFWGEIPEGITGLDDLVRLEQVIAVEAGSSQEAFLETVPGLQLKRVDDHIQALMEVRYGKVAATVIDPSLLSKLRRAHQELRWLEVPLPAAFITEGNAICVSKNRPELAQHIQEAVSKLKTSGTLEQLSKKWGLGS